MENKEKRIIGKKDNISYENVEKFFNERTLQEKKHIYNYVLYLDDKPEVIVKRDQWEKEKMNSLLTINKSTRVLDIGCGVGRWGEFFCKKGAYYVGIDASSNMIDKAKDNLKDYSNKLLINSNLRNIEKALKDNNEDKDFDIIFICGVFMYLNDDDCQRIMNIMSKKCKKGARFCIIESMANTDRLTLNQFYSEDLKQDYSAIYRTVSEYKEMMNVAFLKNFILEFEELFDFSDGLQKKREHVTMEHCFIWKKNN